MTTTAREEQLKTWLKNKHSAAIETLTPASDDASFRRYFRIQIKQKNFIVMDAPPDKEDCLPFVTIATAMLDHGLHVPNIFDADLEQGFLLLSDFGDQQYLDTLNNNTADRLYQTAFDALLQIQTCNGVLNYTLPHYDETIYKRESGLFAQWYLGQLKSHSFSDSDLTEVDHYIEILIPELVAQPQVFVHRDYHSRNLMVLPDDQVGILDFQDALFGPVTYDLVSLLRDCYIDWPEKQVETWVAQFLQQAQASGRLTNIDFEQFMRWFDWTGLQRHLKCIGIFSRLHLRDKKDRYLDDIPRVVRYARSVCRRYKELQGLEKFLIL